MASRDHIVVVGEASANIPDYIMNIICIPEHWRTPTEFICPLTSRIVKYKWHEDVVKSTENIKTHGEKNKVCPIE